MSEQRQPASEVALRPLERSINLSHDDLEVLRATVFKGATDAQLALYARTCRARGLDPFSKEIHAWPGRDGAVEIVVGIDGLRNLAESTGEYRGQHGPWFCGDDGQWTDVWLQKTPPLAAKVTVLRIDREPMTDIALLSEFKKNTPPWNQMPSRMLAKCAEANAIRRLFPRQTTGLYISEELEGEPAPAPQVSHAVTKERLDELQAADALEFDTGDLPPIDVETGEILDADIDDEPMDPDADLWTMDRDQLRADIDTSRKPHKMSWPDVMAKAADWGLNVDKQDELVALARKMRRLPRQRELVR